VACASANVIAGAPNQRPPAPAPPPLPAAPPPLPVPAVAPGMLLAWPGPIPPVMALLLPVPDAPFIPTPLLALMPEVGPVLLLAPGVVPLAPDIVPLAPVSFMLLLLVAPATPVVPEPTEPTPPASARAMLIGATLSARPATKEIAFVLFSMKLLLLPRRAVSPHGCNDSTQVSALDCSASRGFNCAVQSNR